MALRGEPKPWTHIWSPKRLRSQVFRAAGDTAASQEVGDAGRQAASVTHSLLREAAFRQRVEQLDSRFEAYAPGPVP
jgi:hypothetical protein